MITSIADLQLMCGLSSSITEQERAVLTAIHPRVEASVKAFLGYDPEQSAWTEYYPRHDNAGGLDVGGVWDVNASHTRAVWERFSSASDTLQLRNLPVRTISSLYVDTSGRFGKGSGAFPAATAYTEGTDFWGEYEAQYFCASGLLYSYGSWPIEPGSIKVTYTAGYSRLELAGRSTSTTSSDENSEISTKGVDGSGIVAAIATTAVAAMNRWGLTKKHSGAGFVGPIQSESAGDYSYSLASGYLVSLIGTSLPPEAIEQLNAYRHYGVMRA